MKVTRERKIYAAVMAVALLGFVLDRTIYGSREAAETSEPAAALLVPSTSSASAGSTSQNTAEEASLATRLATAVDDQNFNPQSIREPFSSKLPWVAQMPVVAAAMEPSSADQFAQRHALTAVMGTGQSGYAIIDGNCVRMGRTVDGFKLTSLDARSATLESGNTRVKLVLKTGLAANY